ncbi:MAG: bifunctional metallophosphatase/5'-nucleotidase [Bacteroidia bacterium]|nr:bifunctional metallophosphatase/5'-nucleotidase [Bacteroidia bacterium]
MTKIYHTSGCNCGCNDGDKGSNRRDFLKKAGTVTGLGLAFGSITGGSLSSCSSDAKSVDKMNALKSGKAQRFTILQTADIHGQLLEHDEFFWENGKAVFKRRGGMATLKTMINTIRNENPANTIVVDGGDCFQGSGVAALTEGRALIPIINNIGYDLMLPGNWEVVYGKENMIKDLGGYQAAKVCANMFHSDNPAIGKELIFPPYWTKTVAGLKLGFIGYNDPLTPKRQSPAYSNGIEFTDPELNTARYVKYLREYENCAMVFLVTHMGLTQQIDLGNKPFVEGVDYILGADTHERVRQPIETKYTKVTEPGAFGSFLGKLDIVVEDGKIKEHFYELMDVDPSKYKPDAEMQQLVEKTFEPYKPELGKVIGKTKSTLVRYYVLENPMDNFITDAVFDKFKPDVALSNGFRFCPPLVASPEKPSEITNDFLWSMLPVDSQARSGMVSGEKIWKWMEKELENVFAKDPAKRFGGWVVRFSGMKVNFTSKNEMGKRVNWIKIGGEDIDKKKMYKIVACERDGDPEDAICRMLDVDSPHDEGISLHEIIREYLTSHSPIEPKVEGRVECTDQPINLLSQLEGYEYTFR